MSHSDPDELLAELQRSMPVLRCLPERTRLSHAEAAGLDEEQRRAARHPEAVAISRNKNVLELAAIVNQLGTAKHRAAVPLLTELWNNCALQPVRHAAGGALWAIGTPDARRALLDLIEDSDHPSVFLAIEAVFDEDPATAFDRLGHYFIPSRVTGPGGTVIPNAILAVLAPSPFGPDNEMTPLWVRTEAPSWLRQYPRWLRLCAGLRRDKHLGRTARAVLRAADPNLVGPALEQARLWEEPRTIRPATKAPGDLLTRYRRGEFDAVWQELRQHAALAGGLLDEARTVANETMKRVALNADLLAERLAARGWMPLYDELRTWPRAEDGDVMRDIEVVAGGPLPVAVRAFWEVVGGVNLVWNYKRGTAPDLGVALPMNELDPLRVDPPGTVTDLYQWENPREGVNPELADPFNLDLAPDYLHKANTSGGAPYGIELPFLGADPPFENEAHELTFVGYLRLCFRWAGFPRLERHADRADVTEFLRVMTKDFEPF